MSLFSFKINQMKKVFINLLPTFFFLRMLLYVLMLLAGASNTLAQIPLVYDKENTGAGFAAPAMPAVDALPEVRELPNPLEWSDGRGVVVDFGDWAKRRSEIAAEIQHYGIGTKPSVPSGGVVARMDGDTLLVYVTVNDQTLALRSTIHYPKTGPVQ